MSQFEGPVELSKPIKCVDDWRVQTIRRQTSSEVDENVEQQDGVRSDVEDHPARTEVVVEKRYCHWEYDEVSHKQSQHAQVPVEPTSRHSTISYIYLRQPIFDARYDNGTIHIRTLLNTE